MGIIKLIFVILLAAGFFFLLKKFRKPSSTITQQPPSNKMLACSVCNTHIPKDEALIQNEKVYCSKDCLR